MSFSYRKPWDELSVDEKADRLRDDLQTFIEFSNEEANKRNATWAAVAARLETLEAALKRIDAQLNDFISE